MTRTKSMGVVGTVLFAGAALFAAGGCDDDDNGGGGGTTFLVRIENISSPMNTSQGPTDVPLSPGVFAVHTGGNPLFEDGGAASAGLERLAEDGEPNAASSELTADGDVEQSGVFGTGQVVSGQAVEFTINADPGERLSFAMMFIPSNDLFFAPDEAGIDLFPNGTPIDGEITHFIELWDAGTEVNEEPGVGASTKPEQPSNDFGQAENGVVQDAEALNDGFTYPDVGDIIKVTIELQD